MRLTICDAYTPDDRRVRVIEPKPLQGGYSSLEVWIDDRQARLIVEPSRMRDGGTTRFKLCAGKEPVVVTLVLHRRLGSRQYETWDGVEMRRPTVEQRCCELVERARRLQGRNESLECEVAGDVATVEDVATLAAMVADLAEMCRSNYEGVRAVGAHPALA